ncbi:MATH and LRR domain-containing protein PFE0570w-like [Octopus bimaculoides]|uniref:MATH and LRR domain-containing protein PFE0570w-like n=1 Tax=Octopus bimaculoides TaxID=37653 RepID=UPI00071C8301|nr:MATH and LRR domain-containing protein PFE0570w-like [Octopus bimaculoides]|eukprot:XP_014769670.1 PREDICTED: protein PFC0760c-like [Octopus bimaculoides]
MENVKQQSHLVASGTSNEYQTVCVASTSSDGLLVAIKEEPLTEDTYEALHYDKQLDEDADNDDNNNNNDDDDEEDEEDNVERFQIKCIDYDEDSYNNLILDTSALNDASSLSVSIQEKDASLEPPPNEHTKLLKPWHIKQTQRDKYCEWHFLSNFFLS